MLGQKDYNHLLGWFYDKYGGRGSHRKVNHEDDLTNGHEHLLSVCKANRVQVVVIRGIEYKYIILPPFSTPHLIYTKRYTKKLINGEV